MARGFLPPGFRFHPTDVELVQYYLKRKVLGKRLHLDAISVVDMYKFPPWDLPAKACLKSRDLQWYFFCPRGRKYGTGQRVNRSTVDGYWKTTGRDRPIYNDSRLVGRKKTLIFHRGRAPHGDRTDWVVHEYRLEDKQLADAGIVQGSYVLCRVFKKSGLGPKNGEQYGAPFIEEEWEDDAGTECCLFATSCSAVNQSPPSDISSRDIQNAQTGYTSNLLDDTSTGDIITQLEQASPPVQGTGTTPLQLELPSIEARTTIQGEDPNMRFLCQVLWEEYDSQHLHCGAPNCELLDPSAGKQAFAPDSHDLYTDILDPPAFPNLHPVDDCVPDSSFSNVDGLKGMFSGLDSDLEMHLPEGNCHPSSGSYVEINDLWGPLDQSSEQPFG